MSPAMKLGALGMALVIAGVCRAAAPGAPAPAPAPARTPAPVAATQSQAPAPLDFRQALETVLARDPQLGGAREALAATRAQEKAATSRLFPHAGVSSSYARSTDRDLVGNGVTVSVDRRTSQTQAYLRWNLFNGFADKNEIDASGKDVESAKAEVRRAFDDASERVAQAYFDVLRLQALADRSAQRRREVEELGRMVRHQTEAGKGSEADGELVASSLIDARVGDETVRADLAAARSKLQTLLGVPFGRLSDAPPVPLAGDDAPFEALLERASTDNAQWRAARVRAEAAYLRVGIVAPEYLPKLDLELRRKLSGSTSPLDSSTEPQHGWTLNLVYDVPLGGEAGARRSDLQHRALAAEADAHRIGDEVRTQLGETQQHARQALEAQPQLERQVEHLNAVVRASEMQWDAGRRTLMQLIEVRETRYSAQQREADNRWRLITTRVRMLLLTGQLSGAMGIEDATPLPDERKTRSATPTGRAASPR